MSKSRYFLFLALLAVGLHTNAYEVETHELITEHSVTRSVLQSDPTVLGNLGIAGGITGQTFLDSTSRPLAIQRLLMFGSRNEDQGLRATRHFYNPITGRGMNEGNFTNQPASPDWALAPVGTFTGSVLGQRNSYWDARGALLAALTVPSKAERERNFGVAFQSLGQVIHHLQDMAQPQHVRDDVHCSASVFCYPAGLHPRPSWYEAWTNRENVRSALTFRLDPGFAGYNISAPTFTQAFNSPRSFWNTEAVGAVTSAGKGIAEFANRNFVSAGTNFGQPSNFALPAFEPTRRTELSVGELCNNSLISCPDNLLARSEARLTFFGSLGRDNYLNVEIPFSAGSTESIFDQYLEPTPGGQRIFALNRFNFDEFHNHLIPRAVAYSAGMINYFFRGKLDAVAQGAGTLLVTNLSAEGMEGDFGLYYDDEQGTRHAVTITTCRVGSVDVPVSQGKCRGATLASVSADPNTRLEVGFTPPADPAPKPKTAGEYMLVFNGHLGEERADPANGVPGAVVGKLVSSPYNGVLYIAGEDSAHRLRFFKVDRSGVSDVTGVNPLEGLFFSQGLREKAYHFKQAVVTVTPSGTLLHRTVALATRRSNSAGDLSFVSDPVSGALRPVSGIAWMAISPDPTVGSFEFSLSILDFAGRQASLSYTRRFTNAQGQPAQTSGGLRLPDLPTTAGYLYADFSKGVLIVNSDGTEIYPRGAAPFRRFGVRITLAAAPAAVLFDLPQGTSSFTSKPATSTSTVLGECSVDHIRILPNGQTEQVTTTAPHGRTESLVRDQESASQSIVIEDLLAGELLTYEQRNSSRILEQTTIEICEAVALDMSESGPRAKVNLLRLQQTQRIGRTVNEHVLRDGSLQTVFASTGVRPANAGYSCGVGAGAVATWLFGMSYADLAYSYDGFAPCPIQTASEYDLRDDPANPKKRIYRALTHNPRDAVYHDEVPVPTGGIQSVIKFRDDTLAPVEGFIADTSPIGEVFLAKPDLSLIVHEPKPGNMPVLTREMIPADIVRLLAAVWM